MSNYYTLKKSCFLVLASLIFPLSILSPISLWVPLFLSSVILFLFHEKKSFIFSKPSNQELLLFIFLIYSISSIFWTNNFSFAIKKIFEILIFYLCFKILLESSKEFSNKNSVINALTYSFILTTSIVLIDLYFVLGLKPWLSINFDNIFNPSLNNQEKINYIDFKNNYGKGMYSGSYSRGLATLSIFSFIVIACNLQKKFIVCTLVILSSLTIFLGESITSKTAFLISALLVFLLFINKKIFTTMLLFFLFSYLLFIPVIVKYFDASDWSKTRKINTVNLWNVNREIESLEKKYPYKIQYNLLIEKHYHTLLIKLDHRLAVWNYTAEKIFQKFLFGHGIYSSKKLGENDKIGLIEYDFSLDANKYIDTSKDYKKSKKAYAAIPLHPHNHALQIWLELGLFGVTIFIILLASLFKKLLIYSSLNKFSYSLIAGSLFCIIIINQSSFGLWQFWWLSAISYWVIFVNIFYKFAKPLQK